jgi:hypothetical protein
MDFAAGLPPLDDVDAEDVLAAEAGAGDDFADVLCFFVSGFFPLPEDVLAMKPSSE